MVDRINERFGSIPGQLAGGSIVGTTLADAVAASRIMFAIEESMASGQTELVE